MRNFLFATLWRKMFFLGVGWVFGFLFLGLFFWGLFGFPRGGLGDVWGIFLLCLIVVGFFGSSLLVVDFVSSRWADYALYVMLLLYGFKVVLFWFIMDFWIVYFGFDSLLVFIFVLGWVVVWVSSQIYVFLKYRFPVF